MNLEKTMNTDLEKMNLTGEELTIDISRCPCCGSDEIYRTDFDFDCDGGKEIWECGIDSCTSEWEIIYNTQYCYHYITSDDYNTGHNPNQDLDDLFKNELPSKTDKN